MGGRKFFLTANVFTSEHFEPLEKGSLNQRSGAPFQPWVAGLIILATHGVIQVIMRALIMLGLIFLKQVIYSLNCQV